jgi:glyoxylase-like metal-dependent hydrolase (beta-lactamase superfamily II)
MTVLLAVSTMVSSLAAAEREVTLEELTSGWGQDLETAPVSVETLDPGLHVMRAAGGAVLVSIGSDGVLLVDDQYPQTARRIMAKIAELGGGPVDFVVNTHAHFDHADGNPLFAASGARIVAHENARRQMTRSSRLNYGDIYYIQPAYPDAALPVMTFSDSMSIHFNDETIELEYYGDGHTDGDAVVYFRDANVAHVGDLYNARFPYIDPGNGGSLAGLIAVCRSILDTSDEGIRIVSGHAPIATRQDLVAYTRMLESVYQTLSSMAEQGLSVEDVLAADPTAEFGESRGNPALFLTHAYETVLRELE